MTAFVYGRRRATTSANGKNSLRPLPRDQWTALIPGAHPGYITWEAYEANQQILLGNAAVRGGTEMPDYQIPDHTNKIRPGTSRYIPPSGSIPVVRTVPARCWL